MDYYVRFTPGARKDLRAIFEHISENDSPEKARHVIEQIVEAALDLRKLPMRGAHPPELISLGIRAYRQIFFKPYRIFYTVRRTSVLIVIVADGRRDMQSLLMNRLHR